MTRAQRVCGCGARLQAAAVSESCRRCAVAYRNRHPDVVRWELREAGFWARADVTRALAGADWQRLLRLVMYATGITQEALGRMIGLGPERTGLLVRGEARDLSHQRVMEMLAGLGGPAPFTLLPNPCECARV